LESPLLGDRHPRRLADDEAHTPSAANKADEKFSCYLARRLAELPVPPSPSLRRKTPWCGECEDEQSRTITVTLPDGTEAAAFCPRCSPQKRPLSVDQKTANIEER